MGKLVQQIDDLEPARDVRETYKDCLEAGCDPAELEVILDAGVESEDLHPYEGYYIMTGKQPADDFPGFDPSAGDGLKSEKVDEEGNWTPEDIQPGDSGLGPLDDEPQPIDAYGKALELGDIVNMEHDAEDYIVVHLDGLKVGIAEVGDALRVDAKDVSKA